MSKRSERSHIDRHGHVKETFKTLEEAQDQADYLNKWKPRQWHYPSEGYECWVCGLFHVGSRRYDSYITRKQTFICEVGERAYREIIFENRGPQKKRRGRIMGRYYKGNPEELKRMYLELLNKTKEQANELVEAHQ